MLTRSSQGIIAHQAMFEAGIPYTIIDNGPFMEVGLGKLLDWSLPAPVTLETTTIRRWGDGNVEVVTNALPDIARYVVQIVDDPNTINKRIMLDGHPTTQNHLLDLWESITGKKLERKRTDEAELQDMIDQVEGFKQFPLKVRKYIFFFFTIFYMVMLTCTISLRVAAFLEMALFAQTIIFPPQNYIQNSIKLLPPFKSSWKDATRLYNDI